MNSDRWQQVELLVEKVLAIPSAERAAWLSQHCNGDTSLRAEVESLLSFEHQAENFLGKSAAPKASALLVPNPSELHRDRHHVGPYRILREIGHGGMGAVYEAQRDDGEFTQRVALKLIRAGLGFDDESRRRFLHERQILAQLEHPNIARLFDGGTTEDGTPYLAMEYVDGLPLDEFCTENKLGIDRRLEIFSKVCAAVAHAHRHLVVHRDLKPSNIFAEADGTPKLLDFGIAKLLDADDGTQTMTGLRAFTPDYASPEQVLGGQITTASDIYSLGVILYELLAGQRPYKLKGASPEQRLSLIANTEPTQPSRAVVEMRSRETAWTTNPRHLRGDLDNIVLMALRKEPSRRYESVEQFSADIERHLQGLPVLARPNTFHYRADRFIRRNKLAAAAACLIFLTLLGGIVATTRQARRVQEQARIANAKQEEAQKALAKTAKINTFLQSIFSYANPDWFGRAGGKRDLSVLEAMPDIERRIDTEFKDEPEIRADLHQQIGDTYRTQRLYEHAERNLREALRLRLETYGEDNSKVAESMFILSGVRFQQGDMAEHERLLKQALDIQRRHPNDGNNLPYMMVDYAVFLHAYKSDIAGALTLDLEALEEFRRRYGDDHVMVNRTHASLAVDYFAMGDYTQAEVQVKEFIKSEKGADPGMSRAMKPIVALLQIIRSNYQDAETTIKQMQEESTGKDAPPGYLGIIYSTQSFMAYLQGKYTQARTLAEKAIAAVPPNDEDRYGFTFRLALILNKLGQSKRAELLTRAAIESLKKSSFADNMLTLSNLRSVLGESLTAQRRFAEAETVLLEVYETQKARVLPQQYDLIETRQRLAALYRAWGKEDQARNYQ